MRQPNFLGLGAQRAGTTWLDALLRSHPQVYLPSRRKEVHYFDDHYERGAPWYAEFFAEATTDHLVVGEITPRYLFSAAASERIARDLPQAKLIVSLRDPVDRAYSQYALSVRDQAYSADFPTFLRERPEAIERGLYAHQLERYLQHYAPESILVLIFEEVIGEREAAATRIAAFLELDPTGFPAVDLASAGNAGRPARWRKPYALARGIGDWLRNHDLDGPVNVAKRLGVRRLFGRGAALPPLTPELRRRLWEPFAADVEALQSRLDLNLSAWGPKAP